MKGRSDLTIQMEPKTAMILRNNDEEGLSVIDGAIADEAVYWIKQNGSFSAEDLFNNLKAGRANFSRVRFVHIMTKLVVRNRIKWDGQEFSV